MTDTQQVAQEERRWYLGVLLHALNQPLTAVASYVEAARGSEHLARDPLTREALDAARAECVRAFEVARELRDVLGGREDVEFGLVSVNELLEQLAPELPGEAGTRVRLEFDRSVGPVRADSLTLRRSVLALVKSAANTLSHRAHNGTSGAELPDMTTVLRTRVGDDDVQIEVQVLVDAVGYAASTANSPEQRDANPLVTLARSALADLGADLTLGPSEPGSLRFLIRLAPA